MTTVNRRGHKVSAPLLPYYLVQHWGSAGSAGSALNVNSRRPEIASHELGLLTPPLHHNGCFLREVFSSIGRHSLLSGTMPRGRWRLGGGVRIDRGVRLTYPAYHNVETLTPLPDAYQVITNQNK